MGPIEALKFALEKEVEAMGMYERLAQEQPVAKDTFIFLKSQEEKHKYLLEKKIAELTEQ